MTGCADIVVELMYHFKTEQRRQGKMTNKNAGNMDISNGTASENFESEANVAESQIRYKEQKRLLFFGLPFTFTKYIIKDDVVTIDQGLFKTEENDCYMYKIQDVKLTETLAEKMVGLGTITCFTGDTTSPMLVISHVRNAKKIKNFILDSSEKARLRRRTLNTQNIGAGHDLNGDGIDDALEMR